MNKYIYMNKLFPLPPNNNYNSLQIDEESIYFVTNPYDTEIIIKIIKNNMKDLDNCCIFDATACVGGDTISFGKNFKSVISTEINKKRFDMLKNNLLVYELYNVIPVNCSFLDIITKINFIDVVYIDPPWGGSSYKQKTNIRLNIDNVFIDDIINRLFDKKICNSNIKMVVLKIPKNYDIKTLYYNTKNNNIDMLKYDLKKMMIVIFKLK